jgi:3-(3-hydroxy-phenyl)propionate hydroxylase
MLGHGKFDIEWVSIYRFQCRRIANFVRGRVVFCGDSAHQVSPFGARGANSGVQDAENLAWKLARVLSGEADASLIATYDLERGQAADENIRHSTRSTDFIAPHSPAEARLRDAALSLARDAEFAKAMVNSGRLSTASAYDTPLSTADEDAWEGGVPPGAAMLDASLRGPRGKSVFLTDIVGPRFTLLCAQEGSLDLAAAREGPLDALRAKGVDVLVIGIGSGDNASLHDAEHQFADRYDARDGTTYLLRPDGHVAARLRAPSFDRLDCAFARACGGGLR